MNRWGWYAIAAGAALLALRYAGGKLGQAAQAVGTAVNPVDPGNIVNSGVTAVGQVLSGDDAWSLGKMVYEATHTREIEASKQVGSGPAYAKGSRNPGFWSNKTSGSGYENSPASFGNASAAPKPQPTPGVYVEPFLF